MDSTTTWKILELANYSIKYPSSWELRQNEVKGIEFSIISPLGVAKDKFRENVNLLVQNLPDSNMTLDQYVAFAVSQFEIMSDSTVIESKKLTTNSIDFQRIVGQTDLDPFSVKFEQYYWVIDKKAYTLTFTCEKSVYATRITFGEKILSSFTFHK